MTDNIDMETAAAARCVVCIAVLVFGAITAALVYRLTHWPWLTTAAVVLVVLTLPFLFCTLIHVVRAGQAIRKLRP